MIGPSRSRPRRDLAAGENHHNTDHVTLTPAPPSPTHARVYTTCPIRFQELIIILSPLGEKNPVAPTHAGRSRTTQVCMVRSCPSNNMKIFRNTHIVFPRHFWRVEVCVVTAPGSRVGPPDHRSWKKKHARVRRKGRKCYVVKNLTIDRNEAPRINTQVQGKQKCFGQDKYHII